MSRAISARESDRDTSFPYEKTILFLNNEVNFDEILLWRWLAGLWTLLSEPMLTWSTRLLRCSYAKRSWTGKHFRWIVQLRFALYRKNAPVKGRKALQRGVRIANDVAGRQSFKDAAKLRIFGAHEEGINNFVPQADGQSESGNRRKRFRRRPLPRRKQAMKRRKLDIFSWCHSLIRIHVFVLKLN